MARSIRYCVMFWQRRYPIKRLGLSNLQTLAVSFKRRRLGPVSRRPASLYIALESAITSMHCLGFYVYLLFSWILSGRLICCSCDYRDSLSIATADSLKRTLPAFCGCTQQDQDRDASSGGELGVPWGTRGPPLKGQKGQGRFTPPSNSRGKNQSPPPGSWMKIA